MPQYPDLQTQIKIHFERKPPYSEEYFLKKNGEEYKVEYELKVEKPKIKAVVEKNEVEDETIDDKNKINEMQETTGLNTEDLLEITVKFLKFVPDFSKKSEKEQVLIIADVINGKYDNILFGSGQTETKQSDQISKKLSAYKQ
jgi:hypothetical protein